MFSKRVRVERWAVIAVVLAIGTLGARDSFGEGRPCPEGGEFEKVETFSGLDVLGGSQSNQVKLLYRHRDDSYPQAAQIMMDGRGSVFASPNRLIVGFNGPVRLSDILRLFDLKDSVVSAEGAPARELGGGAWLIQIPPGSPAPLDFRGKEKQIYLKAPALSWVSTLRRRIGLFTDPPVGLSLRSVSIDRLFSLEAKPKSPPVDTRPEPPVCLVRQGAVGLMEAQSPSAAVAVVDSGIALHPGLSTVVWQDAVDASGFGAALVGSASTQPGQIAGDVRGHGTEVAGAVASDKLGVAPKAPLVPIRIFDSDGCTSSASVIEGLYSAAKRAQIVVLAWTFSAADNPHCAKLPSMPDGVDEICQAILDAPDVLFIAAAGNQLLDFAIHPFYPAAWSKELPNLMAIGGVDRSDCWNSNKGAEFIDLAGVAGRCKTTTLGSNVEFVDGGTSLAAGFVAGAASLYWAKTPAAKVGDVRKALSTNARLFGTKTYQICCKDCGVLDVAKILGGPVTKVSETICKCQP
jgi:hypothetical protein